MGLKRPPPQTPSLKICSLRSPYQFKNACVMPANLQKDWIQEEFAGFGLCIIFKTSSRITYKPYVIVRVCKVDKID